jgi:tRNA(fMet)-specific endonuclease VapC
MYLLDTNIVSYWMRGDRDVIEKIKSVSPGDLSLSAITVAEIYYGIEKSQVKKAERREKIERICSQLEIFPFDASAAAEYGPIRAKLEKQGTAIGERDLQIAAIALANRLCVVTHNTKEFNRVAKLQVEDWAFRKAL